MNEFQEVLRVECKILTYGIRGEHLLNEFQEALRVECRVYGRDGQGIKLKRFICMFNLLTHVVILQNINDTKVQNNIICFMKHLGFLFSWNQLCPCWHVHTKLDLEPAKKVAKKISTPTLQTYSSRHCTKKPSLILLCT